MSHGGRGSDLFSEICTIPKIWGFCRLCEKYIYDSHFPESISEEDIGCFINTIHHLMVKQVRENRNIPYFLFWFESSVIVIVRYGNEYVAILLRDIEYAEDAIALVRQAAV